MRRALAAVAVAVMVAGIALVAYPHVNALIASVEADHAIEAVMDRAAGQGATDGYAGLRSEMEAYNAALGEDESSVARDAWSYEQAPVSLSDYGVVDEAVGYVEIDAMDVRLPLYLGATTENLARGLAVMGGTSMPIGGEGTNCVIAGHRGGSGIPMLIDIEKLAVGDEVRVTNLWETLVYRVVDIEVVWPDDTEVTKVQPGRDLVTLVTCHPYPTLRQRYVVVCEREGTLGEASIEAAGAETYVVPESSQAYIDEERAWGRWSLVGVCAVAAALLVACAVSLVRRGRAAPRGRHAR